MEGLINGIINIDVAILQFFVDNVHNPVLDVIMKILTMFGEGGIFWIAVCVVCMAFPKTRKIGFTMAIAMLLGFAIGNGIIKNVVARHRPYELAQFSAFPIVKKLSDWSFPSGHTLASFEAAVSIFCWRKKWGAAALALALCVAVSRIYLIVHYPSDVIAGALLGTAFALVAFFIIKTLYTKYDLDSRLLFRFEKERAKKSSASAAKTEEAGNSGE